jgi:HD-GYP domain-containing protein (c-di-GMP phosphodiesterase class II)
MTSEQALEELRHGAGTQFDPDFVKCFAEKVVPALAQSQSVVEASTSPSK